MCSKKLMLLVVRLLEEALDWDEKRSGVERLVVGRGDGRGRGVRRTQCAYGLLGGVLSIRCVEGGHGVETDYIKRGRSLPSDVMRCRTFECQCDRQKTSSS